MATQKINANRHMCVVTIGYVSVLMPSTNGVKLVELLRDAQLVDKSYDHERAYTLRGEVNVEYETAKASQLRTNSKAADKGRAPVGPLLLGQD